MSAKPEQEPGGDRVFGPTSGVFTGWLGVVLAAIVIGSIVVSDRSVTGVRFALGTAVVGVLLWCVMLRPRLVIGATELELRNMFSAWHVPLAGIHKVMVRAVTRVHTDERRFDGVAVGRPARSLGRGGPRPPRSVVTLGGTLQFGGGPDDSRQHKGNLSADALADFVTEQVLAAADGARSAAQPVGRARRTWAVPELVALAALVVALGVSLLL